MVKSMLPIIVFKSISEFLEFAQEAKRWPLDFENSCRYALGYNHGCVTRLTGEHRHLAKAILNFNLADFPVCALIVFDVHIQTSCNEDIKRVASPIAFTNNFFAFVVNEQSCIGPDALFGVRTPINHQFEI